MVSPLQNLPFISPTAAYSFIKDIAAALKLITAVQTLITWLRGFLKDAEKGIARLGALDLEDHISNRRRKTLKDLVPEAPTQSQMQKTYVI